MFLSVDGSSIIFARRITGNVHFNNENFVFALKQEDCTARLWSITDTETKNVQVLTHAQEVYMNYLVILKTFVIFILDV